MINQSLSNEYARKPQERLLDLDVSERIICLAMTQITQSDDQAFIAW
jgi:hypothetical protein